MADISMCNGRECPSKEKCYRFTAPINVYRQSYSDFDLRKPDGQEKCEDFSLDDRTEEEK